MPQGHILLVCVQLVVHQDPQVLCKAAFQLVGTGPFLVHGVDLPQLQDLVLHVIGLHEILVGPFLQPVDISLNDNTATWHIIRCISCTLMTTAEVLEQNNQFFEEWTSVSSST